MSALRWLLVDTAYAWTGVPRPTWNDAVLSERLAAFEALVDAHFRYYQFYSNMAVAVAIFFLTAIVMRTIPTGLVGWWIAFIAIEFLFLITSRDNLQKYYRRASRLLGERR